MEGKSRRRNPRGGILQEAPRRNSESTQDAPRKLPGDSQRLPEGSQVAPRGSQVAPRGSQEAPRGSQEAPRSSQTLPGGSQKLPDAPRRLPGCSQRQAWLPWLAGGVLGVKCAKFIVFYCRKWRDPLPLSTEIVTFSENGSNSLCFTVLNEKSNDFS